MAPGDSAPDGITLLEVIRFLEDAGYTAQLVPADEGQIRCLVCAAVSPAAGVYADRLCRTEGASDPDDMVAVAAVRCPRCGARGTLALKYGPGASPDEAEILAHLDRSGARPAAAPG
ncbi:MAG TPA: hypothetical protein VFJ85_05450 [Acidimicrobiales bacterium]|nr:hypothetical protein [Acidimicrobiales bacterium]